MKTLVFGASNILLQVSVYYITYKGWYAIKQRNQKRYVMRKAKAYIISESMRIIQRTIIVWRKMIFTYWHITRAHHFSAHTRHGASSILKNKKKKYSNKVAFFMGFVHDISDWWKFDSVLSESIWYVLYLVDFFLCLIGISTLYRLFNAKAILLEEQ